MGLRWSAAPAVQYLDPIVEWRPAGEDREVVEIYLPGFKKDQVRVQMDDYGVLRATGERPERGGRRVRFRKDIHLPHNCDVDGVRVEFIPKLVITLPIVAEEASPTLSASPESETLPSPLFSPPATPSPRPAAPPTYPDLPLLPPPPKSPPPSPPASPRPPPRYSEPPPPPPPPAPSPPPPPSPTHSEPSPPRLPSPPPPPTPTYYYEPSPPRRPSPPTPPPTHFTPSPPRRRPPPPPPSPHPLPPPRHLLPPPQLRRPSHPPTYSELPPPFHPPPPGTPTTVTEPKEPALLEREISISSPSPEEEEKEKGGREDTGVESETEARMEGGTPTEKNQQTDEELPRGSEDRTTTMAPESRSRQLLVNIVAAMTKTVGIIMAVWRTLLS